MSQIAGLESTVGVGPPGDVGGFLFPATALAFRFTFSGVTYYAVIRSGVRGWVLVGTPSTTADVPINAAYGILAGGARIILLTATFPIINRIWFTNDYQVLDGQGAGSFIDADGLIGASEAAIVIQGVNYCTARNIRVQTKNGGGGAYDCIFIDDANFFTIEGIIISDSDRHGIYIYDASWVGWIINNFIYDTDDYAIYTATGGAATPSVISIIGNTILGGTRGMSLDLQISEVSHNIIQNILAVIVIGIYFLSAVEVNCTDNIVHGATGSGIYAVTLTTTKFTDNTLSSNGAYGIDLSAPTCVGTLVKDNTYTGNVSGAIQDLGTDTRLPELFIKVSDPNGFIGTHPAIVLTDGVTIIIRDQIEIPMEFQELVRAQAVIVPGGTGNMRRAVATSWGKIGTAEHYNNQTDSIAAGEVAVTTSHMETLDISAVFTGIAAGDLVGLAFTREGAHGNDTVNADCYYLGMRVQYV